jgi:hypothetical protein
MGLIWWRYLSVALDILLHDLFLLLMDLHLTWPLSEVSKCMVKALDSFLLVLLQKGCLLKIELH